MCLRVMPPVLAGFLWLMAGAASGAEPAVMHLMNGGYIPGELRASDDPKVLTWRSPFFADPLLFPLSAVKAVQYPAPAKPPQAAGAYRVELVNDDLIYGDLLALTADEVELNVAPIGRLHLRRERVRRISRQSAADVIYDGPNGLAGWSDPAATPQWRDEGGQLSTDRQGATLFANLDLPEKALIELDLTWQVKADFVFALGVGRKDVSLQHSYRFEVWDGTVVAVAEAARDANVAVLQEAGALGGELRLRVYFDQQARRLILVSRTGEPLADLNARGSVMPLQTGVRLTNGKGDVCLEHVRVTRWDGVPPGDLREDQARIHRTDGSIVYGQIAAYNPESKQFTIRDGTTNTVVLHEALAEVFLGRADGNEPADPETRRTLRVVYRDGTRFSGTPTRIDDGNLTLNCPGINEALRLPLADVRSLIPLRHGERPVVPVFAGRSGRLEMEGLSLKGQLVGDDGQSEGSLTWHPDLARNSSPLLPGLSGRIVYRDPPPPPPPGPAARMIRGRRFVMINGGWTQQEQPEPPKKQSAAARPSMRLRTGDTIPCEVTRIDEKGVTLKTPQSDVTFVPHEKIKSVELIAARKPPHLDTAKRDRLLTLPRMQRDSPPTHLICSKNGDFLRGRIVEMDDARLKVEVRLEEKEIPRDRVAQIIWLHADELTDQKPAAAATGPRETRAQTINAEGNRLTFMVGKSDGTTVSGTSDVLGACQAKLADVDQLLFGSFIEQSAARAAYNPWKLHHAPEPKFAQADADSATAGVSTGIDSPLVGQPASAFHLDLLDGAKFTLADHKGRVVVLDFWATWCGPCMQTMPLVDSVIREFSEGEVDFVAVNMEEQPDQVKSILERHKMKMAVALDRDGAVAAKYAVTAIPQTVVIGRDGKVARLFVGGGKSTADSLRKALQELTAK